MQTKKEQKTNISEMQAQRAFWLSIGTGLVMLIILSIFLVTDSSRPLRSPKDVRVFVAAIAMCSFISAWLTRRGKAVFGVCLILVALYVSAILTALSIANIGAILAAMTLVFTFSVASAVFPSTRMANYANSLALVVASMMVLLDIFQPFVRAANDDRPEITWALTAFLILVYGVLIFRQFGSYALRTKLIISFLAATLIPLAVLTYLNDRNTRQALTDDANTALLSAASTTATQLDTFMLQNLDFVRSQAQLPDFVDYIYEAPGLRAYSEKKVARILNSIRSQDSVYIDSVALLDIQGNTLVDTYISDIGVNKSDRDYFKGPLKTGLPYASNVEFSETTGAPSIYFSALVRDEAGSTSGIFRIRYRADILQEIVSSDNNLIGQGSFATLLDGQTHVRLAHGTTPSIIFKSVVPLAPATVKDLQARHLLPAGSPQELSTNLPDFETALENYKTQPFFLTELKVNETTLDQGAIVTMQTQDWHVIYAQSQDTFLAPINTQARASLVLTLVIALLVVGFAVFISVTLAGPIVRLTQVANTIAGGDINIQAKVETGDEIGTLAGTFNRMTQQLRDFIANLEERVAARTKDLATVAAISTQTSTIQDPYQMLSTAVHLTQRGFGLYHAHVFTYNKESDELGIVACGYKEGDEHEGTHGTAVIPVTREQSLVARAGRTQKPVIVNDVHSDPGWLPNPLLPDTRAEMAVPMIVGNELLGVLDVQADHVDAFTDADANIQMTLASQIATALKNAQSYSESKAQADLESLVNAIGQKIQRTTTVEDTLQTAIREIGLALGASRVSANIQAGVHDGNEREGRA